MANQTTAPKSRSAGLIHMKLKVPGIIMTPALVVEKMSSSQGTFFKRLIAKVPYCRTKRQ